MRSVDSLALVLRAKEGDREAFDSLVAIHKDRLEAALAPALGRLRGRGIDAEDVLQETLARAFESIGRFEWTGEDSFSRWLYGIAKNVMLKALRQDRRAPRLAIPRDVAVTDPSPSRAARREDRMARLEKAVEGLTPDQRQAVLLSRIDGVQTEEIAQRMGRSPAAVRQLLVRALRALKSSIGETESLHLPPRALKGGSPDAR